MSENMSPGLYCRLFVVSSLRACDFVSPCRHEERQPSPQEPQQALDEFGQPRRQMIHIIRDVSNRFLEGTQPEVISHLILR